MNLERWKRIDELLGAAMDVAPEDRSRFLAQGCGDDEELRKDVERLLTAHEQAGKFIETSAMGVAARAVAGETLNVRTRQKIGPYRIISLLGAGGMGEVYLAEDTRLARRIALKILPYPFLADLDRVRRFEREARAASALNHPNIVTIYDIGEADSINYIATEYVEGETLRTRLHRGQMKVTEAIKVGIQITEALMAAHGAGITHRDIKPENIVLRSDGHLKVLDFGLAKLAAEPRRQSGSLPPLVETQSGQMFGTVKYMSPEEALGQPVDYRTDLWSTGVVLYEMVTGQAPFSGATPGATFDAIINYPPPPATELNADLPAELNSIINRTLEKDAELRYQTAADLRADLRRLQREIEPRASKLGRAVTRIGRAGPAQLGWPATGVLAAGALLLLVIAAWLFFTPKPPVRRESGPDWTSARSIKLTSEAGPEYFPNLAPDGKGIIYASRLTGNWDIFWQRVGGRNLVNLTKDSPADDTQPVYSPDGNHIAFRSERTPRGIYVMEATSENVKRVADVGHHPSWSPDSKNVVVSVDPISNPTSRSIIPSALWIINVESQTKSLLTEGDAVQPSWSPHGDRIAYWGVRAGGQRDIWTIPAAGGEPVQVTSDQAFDWNPLWSADGRYLYFASDRGGSMNFWRVLIDEKTGQVSGGPESVTTPSAYSQHLSFSRDGKRMAYVQKAETENLQRVAFDPASGKTTSAPESITKGARYVASPDVSPDGEWIVYSSQGERQEDIFLIKNDGATQRQLTNDAFKDRFPRWSPDGSRIAFYTDRSGRYEVWSINADGGGLQQLTHTSGPPVFYPVWSPDGSQIVYKQRGATSFVVNTNQSGQSQPPLELTPSKDAGANFWPWSWSADGRRLAGWWRDPTGPDNHIAVYSFETQEYEHLTSLGNRPVWLQDSRRLFFHNDGRIYILDSVTRKVQEIIADPSDSAQTVSSTRDDRMLYYTLVRTEADIWLLNLEEPDK